MKDNLKQAAGNLKQAAGNLKKESRLRTCWRWTTRALAVIVVFVTTYLLILPALTMQDQPECGRQEHLHEAGCFTRELTCLPHAHSPDCVDAEGVLTCVLPEIHIHSESCQVAQVICAVPEEPGHSHSEACQTEEKVCSLAGHAHDETCYTSVLTCTTEEHTHSESCTAREEAPGQLCAMAQHSHTEACGEECSIPAHIHEAACFQTVDPEADLETAEMWQASWSVVSLTGSYTADVPAIAATQLGYTESKSNVALEGENLEGYSRYGAWHGTPYAPWNALFAGFVLESARVRDFPMAYTAGEWLQALEASGQLAAPDTYNPKTGDLVFFGEDRVGILTAIAQPSEEGRPALLQVIQGDVNGAVVRTELTAAEAAAYGVIPQESTFGLAYSGEDYTVTVTVPRGINIPENARLAVREILPDTEEYEGYYRQSVEALLAGKENLTEEDLAISFARYFDITILVDGVETEPEAPVDIRITYAEGLQVDRGDQGRVVHFAESGTEVLEAETDEEAFQFTQGSFSVSGTLVTAEIGTAGTRVEPYQIDNTAGTLYVLYTQIGNNWYALDGNGNPVAITVSGSAVTVPSDVAESLLWSFTAAEGNYVYNPIANLGTGRCLHPFNNGGGNQGVTTGSTYSTSLTVSGSTFKIRGAGNYYLRFPSATQAAVPTNSADQATSFYAAEVGQYYNVWFDGTVGGMMSYYGAANENRPVFAADGSVTVQLPETWQSSTKYAYKLRGWYDIYNYKYYPVDPTDDVIPTATLSGSTVFYADWIAATYDVGQRDGHTVESVDTNHFITTYVFDYNALFNVLSQTHTGTISAAGHSETWSMADGNVPYTGSASLGFSFIDYDSSGEFSYPNGRNNAQGNDINTNQGDRITSGIVQNVYSRTGVNLLDLLFDPNTEVIGKYYAGQGNYLFQYMDSTTPNYDGIHDGYYYLDARLNAASYNQSLQRFYLYDYLERTSDSRKDGGVGEYSDFLPFNSPYLFREDQLDTYVDRVLRTGYEYDAKDGGNNHPEYNSLDDAATNYFFGTRTDIEFFLPNDAGSTDEYGNYGNISTRGEHMIFDFHGDDDVWVFIDGELVLDIGGLHGVMFGQIDFSTGVVITGKDGGTTVSQSFTQLLGHNITEGTHTMQIYYMERGSSQSNCAIYFNIAPRYDLEITKEDIVSAEYLDGAVFTIYNDEAMTSPAQLWDSEEAHNLDMADGTIDNAKSSFTVVDGVAGCWGISAGKTYYIYETTPPPGYPASDDMIRITLNNRGTATIETTTLHGPNGVATEGFAVIKQNINETLKIVALTVTNQKEGDFTEVRVEKTWDGSSVEIPQSITVFLTADGVPVGRRAVLSESNGWSYTWTGLAKYRDEGIDQEIVYEVQEVLVPGYITTQGESRKVENYTDWIRVDQMSDSKIFLLVHNGQALTCNGSFGWMSQAEAEQDSSLAAQWRVTTDHDGFHLKNGLGYTLTYSPGGFYGVNNDALELNQVAYYLNSRLVFHDHDVYYQFGPNGSVVSADGLAFTLYQKEVMTGFLTNIINVPVEEENRTFVEVHKVWSDGNDMHASGSVIIRLYADGKDTGRYLTLNAENGWQGGFYELPTFQTDGTTKILYTVVEDPVPNYTTEYSEGTALPGIPKTMWRDADTLEAGATYLLTVGGNALAVEDGTVTSAARDAGDSSQYWQAVSYNGSLVLRNVGANVCLARNGTYLYTVSQQDQAVAVTVQDGKILLSGAFMEIGSGYAAATSSSANASRISMARQTEIAGQPGTSYTVTNRYGTYSLPKTGGSGTYLFTLSGLLLTAAAVLMYTQIPGRKHQKGGGRHKS